MSHEVESMAWANEVPWHGLGKEVPQNVSVEEMTEAAGLRWTLEKVGPLSAVTETDQGPVEIKTDRFAVVRSTDRKVMTVCAGAWEPMQPVEVMEFMRDYVAAGEATLETAGSLRGGKVIWSLARLNHSFEVTAGDRVGGYLLITAPNEVGKGITVRTTTIRVVCANTMAMAMDAENGQTEYRQSHIGGFREEDAKEAVGRAHERLAEAERRAKTISKLKLSIDDAVQNVLAPVFFPAATEEALELINAEGSRPKRLEEIITSIRTAPGQDGGVQDTGWGILNGVTHWADHVAGRTAEARLHRSWLGDNGVAKRRVEQKLLELAQ